MGKRILGILLFIIPATLFAQEKWNLRRAVDYAMQNNISVKQADVQARYTALQLQQAKLNKIPTASLGTGFGLQFGRSIDPTTNLFTTTQLLYQNYQLQVLNAKNLMPQVRSTACCVCTAALKMPVISSPILKRLLIKLPQYSNTIYEPIIRYFADRSFPPWRDSCTLGTWSNKYKTAEAGRRREENLVSPPLRLKQTLR